MRFALTVILGFGASAALAQGNLSFERQRAEIMLNQSAKEIQKHYYDPKLHGLDWPALTAEAKQKIKDAQSVGQMMTAIFYMVDKLKDSHTLFIPPSRRAKIDFGFYAQPYGERIFVEEVLKDEAAAAAGLQPGDEIVTFNGFKAERATWLAMNIHFHMLQPIAAMELGIVRDGAARTIPIKAKIEEGSKVETDLDDAGTLDRRLRERQRERDKWKKEDESGVTDGVGYLEFRAFYSDRGYVENRVSKVKGAKAVVLDLRGNGGGRIDAIGWLAGHFGKQREKILDMVGRDKTEPVYVEPTAPLLEGPLFILADSASASSSEIFARHMQRTGRAKIIGDQTAGLVEASRTFPQQIGADTVVFYDVQISTGHALLADGEALEKKGVTPDVACLPTAKDLHDDLDPCRKMAEEMARKSLAPAEPEKAAPAN